MHEVSPNSNIAEQLENLPLEPSKTNDGKWQLWFS
jgi:hypothetical protein